MQQALEQGHEVTAFVRDAARLRHLRHARLHLIEGDVLNPADVEKAVTGHDAVLCAIGVGAKRSTLREMGTRNIVTAMKRAGVRRLICLSSYGVGDTRASLKFFTRYIVVGIFLRHAFADHERQEAVVRASELAPPASGRRAPYRRIPPWLRDG